MVVSSVSMNDATATRMAISHGLVPAPVVAPVVGPTLGGGLADNLSWRWAFMINGPVGLITMGLIALVLREPEAAAARRRRLRGHGDRFGAVRFALPAHLPRSPLL